MKNWVVLLARTGSEEKLVQTLKEALDAEEYLPFVSTKEVPYRSKGVIHTDTQAVVSRLCFHSDWN